MTFRIRIDPDMLRKIQRLMEDGLYKDEYDFFRRAIKNQLEDDYKEGFEQITEPSHTSTEEKEVPKITFHFTSFQELKEKLNDALENTILTKYEKPIKSLQELLYGPGSAGFIWIFHNRFFPVKIVLYQLASLIAEHKSNWIDLDELKENASDLAAKMSDELSKIETSYGSIVPSTGLPVSRNKLTQRYYRKRKKDEKINIRISSSKKRFADQFVGRVVKKGSGEILFSGACYEMGLISIEQEDDKWKVSLTENGKRFASMTNPLAENILTSNLSALNKSHTIFSEEEIQFIREKIYPLYELENDISNTILKLKDKITTEKIAEVVKTKKSHQMSTKYTKDALDVIRTSYELKPDEDTVEWIINRYLEFQAANVVGKLSELGLLKREMEGKQIYYRVT